jgi:outer membrane lipoprotein LolB
MRDKTISLLPKHALGWLVLLILLSGCAVTPRREAAPFPPGAEIKKLELSGRLAYKQGKEGHSGVGVRWLHWTPRHEITVLTPLGTTVAKITQDADGVTLVTSDKEQYHAANADQLMEQVLGWRLPLNGMQYWVLGRAAPDSEAQRVLGPDQRLAHLRQQDWDIDYSDYRLVAATEFPGKIIMRRDDVQIRFVVDSIVPLPDAP